MLYFRYAAGKLIEVTADHCSNATTRHDIQNLAHAEEIATDATRLTGRLHIGVDQGDCTWPRYDVIEAPKVGDPVSRAFNGDYYPAGTITKVSPTLKRVETSTGVLFFRVRETASWRSAGTWWMYRGHRSELNPSF